MSAMKEELVGSGEAAHLLGVSTRQLQKMVKSGVLKPHPSSPSTVKKRLFRVSDIGSLREIRDKGHNPEAAFVLARQSAMEAQALRREVSRIKFVLGLDIPALPTDRDSLISTLLKAEDALRGPHIVEHEEMITWARIFHGISEVHFEAIAFYTDQKEPWRVFLALARKICAGEGLVDTNRDPELHSIYRILGASLQRLRRTAYFYIRNLYGKVYAARLLPEVKGCPHEDVIAMSFNNMLWEAPAVPPNPGTWSQTTSEVEYPVRSPGWVG